MVFLKMWIIYSFLLLILKSSPLKSKLHLFQIKSPKEKEKI